MICNCWSRLLHFLSLKLSPLAGYLLASVTLCMCHDLNIRYFYIVICKVVIASVTLLDFFSTDGNFMNVSWPLSSFIYKYDCIHLLIGLEMLHILADHISIN